MLESYRAAHVRNPPKTMYNTPSIPCVTTLHASVRTINKDRWITLAFAVCAKCQADGVVHRGQA